jgi:hypothetical protein
MQSHSCMRAYAHELVRGESFVVRILTGSPALAETFRFPAKIARRDGHR